MTRWDGTAEAWQACLLIIVLWAGLVVLMANVTAWAWNIVVFGMFHGPGPIDGWQGLAINILFSVIAGAFRGTADK